LLANPQRFGFFQAVRMLERWLDHDGGAEGGRVQRHTGVLTPRLHFRNSLSLSFAASEIESLTVISQSNDVPAVGAASTAQAGADLSGMAPAESGVTRVELTPAFIGLLGSGGALPLHYTELIAQSELQQRDASARAFLDLFTHRAASLFYAAWKKHRLHVQYESGQRDHFLPLMLALAGLGQGSLRDRLEASMGGVPDEAVAYFAGTTQRRPVSATQLRGLLQAYLGVAVRVDQFVGRWYALPPEAGTALGLSNGVLGVSALAGERAWQRDLCLRVVLGPLSRAHCLRFLPGGAGEQALRQWLQLLCGVSFDYEVRLRLRRDAVTGTVLGGETNADALSGRLGWDTFLRTEPENQDREDVVYDIRVD
jgi:type VI secretion system protein ImpH